MSSPTIPPTPAEPEVQQPLPEGVDKLEKQADGTYYVKLADGTEFKGSESQVIGEIGKAKVETAKWAKALRDNPPTPQPVTPVKTQEEISAEQTRSWLAEQTAIAEGYGSHAEKMQQLSTWRKSAEDFQNQQIAASFFAARPSFSQLNDDTEKLMNKAIEWGLMREDGKDVTSNKLISAYDRCITEGIIKPLDQNQMNVASGGQPPRTAGATPPPMLQPTQPENTASRDLWGMPLDDLRKQILGQQKR